MVRSASMQTTGLCSSFCFQFEAPIDTFRTLPASKRRDQPYEQFLRESVHHGADPAEGAAIELSFRHASQGEEHLYEVTRSWSEVRGRMRERVWVYRDGEADGYLSQNWNQLVEELIPLGIAQLCFFDAEKIRLLADDETTTLALGGKLNQILGPVIALIVMGAVLFTTAVIVINRRGFVQR